MRARAAAVVLVFALAPLRAEGAPPEPVAPKKVAVFFADPARAIAKTRDGKKVKADVDRAREEVEANVKVREAKVHALRKTLEKTGRPADRRAYDEEAAALAKWIADEEARLEALEQSSLAPIVDRVDAAITAVPASRGVIIDAGEHPPLVPAGACDATAWLAQVIDGDAKAALPEPAPCLRRVVLFADVRAVGRATPEAKALTASLDTFVRDRQTALDARSRELAKLEPGPEAERRRLELAERYQAYEAELRAREREVEDGVAAAVRRFAGEVSASLSDTVLVDRGEGSVELPIPACDVTTWLVDLLQKRAAVGPPVGCPAYTASEAKR